MADPSFILEGLIELIELLQYGKQREITILHFPRVIRVLSNHVAIGACRSRRGPLQPSKSNESEPPRGILISVFAVRAPLSSLAFICSILSELMGGKKFDKFLR